MAFIPYAANIAIIESQSYTSGHDMDLKRQTIASSMGHTASVLPQTTLDNNGFSVQQICWLFPPD
ncbi:MAG: hypothetical protein IPN26_17715 [Bacteroidetes bacterium]|nr:hypothetical protein [Bacteroidota bacterium]